MSDDESALVEAAAELDAVQEVLGRLDDGTFDQCVVCGGPIGAEQLKADPLNRTCRNHTPAPAQQRTDESL